MDLQIHTWFVPTMYGDIRLKAKGKNVTQVEICKLTPAELKAVQMLKDHSISPGLLRTEWAKEADWLRIVAAFEVGSSAVHTIDLAAPIASVERVITKALRRDRKVVTVASCKPGEFVEIHADVPDEPAHGTSPHREPAPAPKEESATTAPKPAAVAAAVSVQQPVRGCPAPDFEAAQIRASEVLRTFLLPEQIEDFEKRQQFVSVGAYTGHRYAITSRHARSALSVNRRTVYDLDERRPYCVHDWEIPPAEEMLTMHLLLSLPQYESYIRGLGEN